MRTNHLPQGCEENGELKWMNEWNWKRHTSAGLCERRRKGGARSKFSGKNCLLKASTSQFLRESEFHPIELGTIHGTDSLLSVPSLQSLEFRSFRFVGANSWFRLAIPRRTKKNAMSLFFRRSNESFLFPLDKQTTPEQGANTWREKQASKRGSNLVTAIGTNREGEKSSGRNTERSSDEQWNFEKSSFNFSFLPLEWKKNEPNRR